LTTKFWQRFKPATVACAALLAGCAQPATAPQSTATQGSVEAHVERARQIAGEDLRNLMRLCEPQPAERAAPSAAADEGLRKLIARPAPPPMQVFDNLYFVGGDWVSAWVLKTSAGLILIDALNNANEAGELIEGGMAKLGLDPREIKYIVVTHGHGDHYGGAKYLVDKYHPRVVATDADWNMMHGKLEFDSAVWGPPPARDMSVGDGQTLTLGDTTITFLVTTGHTLGTLSPMFDVRTRGRVHHAVLWGGTSFNFGKDFSRLASYTDNTERLRALAASMPIDVLVSNHSEWDGSIAKMNALRGAGAGAANPFVTGQQVVGRSMQVMGECARAQAGRFGY
jgi:metallo-beta-lactamase class B